MNELRNNEDTHTGLVGKDHTINNVNAPRENLPSKQNKGTDPISIMIYLWAILQS